MNERLTLTSKELKRLRVLEMVQAEQTTVAEAVRVLGISERHGWRLWARYRQAGAAGLAHGSRGRPSTHRLAEAVRTQVVQLAEGTCRDYNHQHLTEVLREEFGVQVSRASVRRIRRALGLASPRQYRRRRGYLRRARYVQFGMLWQVDASIHSWLEDRGPRLALVAAIDDATNQVLGALFRPQEDAAGYVMLLRMAAATHGLPLAIYADRHTIFQSPAKPTLEQELAGVRPQSQFGRLLSRLDVQLIAAHSPQAKGRIERLWGTLQDRLVKELRAAQATTLEQANRVLIQHLVKHNQRFSRPAGQPGSACRPLPPTADLDRLFAFHYQRQVSNDHSITLAGQTLALPPLAHGRSYARAKVDLYHSMDGQLAVYYQDQLLTTFLPAQPGAPRVESFAPLPPATPFPAQSAKPVVSSSSAAARPTPKPARNHPWRQPIVPKRNPPTPPPANPHPDIFTDRLP